MSQPLFTATRRSFLAATAATGVSLLLPPAHSAQAIQAAQETGNKSAEKKAPEKEPADLLVIGPRPGYTPDIGTMVSMLTYIQQAVVGPVKGMSQADLDYLFDPNSNTIGALLLHLAATETYYQMNTFGNMKWDSWSDDLKKKWDPAMNLGDAGRKAIKGHDLDFYLSTLHETREKTLAEFKKHDDAWLQSGETEQFGTEKVNIHWKWFHVCEHESHHSGQISWLAKRLPGAKPSKESGV